MRCKIATKHADATRSIETDERAKRAVPWVDERPPDAVVLGIPFGGPNDGKDDDGEAFHPGTDVWLKVGDTLPVTYYHGFGPDDPRQWQETPHIIGTAKYIRMDDRGHWFVVQYLDDAPLAKRVITAHAKGAPVRASSGAVGHLVRVDEAGMINVWPVGELAVFDTNDWRRPANDYAIVEPVAEALGQRAKADDAVEAKASEQGVIDMNEKTTPPHEQEPMKAPPPALDMDAMLQAVRDAAKSAATDAVGEFAAKFRLDGSGVAKAPAVISTRGDSFAKAAAAWVRTGQPADGLLVEGAALELKASNPVDMVIGTDTAGGYAAPDDFLGEIIAKRGEALLATKLGVRRIPGSGTTVLVPIDANTSGGDFVSTAEGAAYDKDTPGLAQKSMTLGKYTKQIPLSQELLADEDARLMSFLTDFIARGMANTHNNLLLTEVATNGTSFKTFASNSAIAAGELQDIVYNDTVANYLDDGGSVGWVMRSSTYGDVISLQGNPFIYDFTPQGGNRNLVGYPVAFSSKSAAVGSSAKSVYFGNWYFVGWREAPGITIVRDPYSNASTGMVNLWVYFRTVYTVLIADAIGYGVHPV